MSKARRPVRQDHAAPWSYAAVEWLVRPIPDFTVEHRADLTCANMLNWGLRLVLCIVPVCICVLAEWLMGLGEALDMRLKW